MHIYYIHAARQGLRDALLCLISHCGYVSMVTFMPLLTIDTCASIREDTVTKCKQWAQDGVAFYSTGFELLREVPEDSRRTIVLSHKSGV